MSFLDSRKNYNSTWISRAKLITHLISLKSVLRQFDENHAERLSSEMKLKQGWFNVDMLSFAN